MSSLLKLSIVAREKVVKVSDDEGFVVRGLTPVDVFELWQRHTGAMGDLFARIVASVKATGAADMTDLQDMTMTLVTEMPVLTYEVIVVASANGPMSSLENFDAAFGIASRLPIGAVADALAKIAELTFTSDMPPGKFLTLVVTLMQRVTGVKVPSPAT